MRIIEGCLEELIARAKDDPDPHDYLLIRLLDKHALYEPMAKLREVYPNILQLEKPNLSQGGERQLLKRENLKKGELPMFLDFYQQMTGDELDEGATKLVANLLDQIHKGVEL
jgi:exonuclease SbcD